VGVCSTFYRFPEGVACLWEAVVGRSGRGGRRTPTTTMASVGPGAQGLAARAPAVATTASDPEGTPPSLVALDLFPAFYALVRGGQRARDFAAEYRAGRMSAYGQAAHGQLLPREPSNTPAVSARHLHAGIVEDARVRAGHGRCCSRALWIVKTEERYEPSFSIRWDLLERWLPDQVAEGRTLSRTAALDRLPRPLSRRRRLFDPGSHGPRVRPGNQGDGASRGPPGQSGRVRAEVEVTGWPGSWVVKA
jgi:hypothetical protein